VDTEAELETSDREALIREIVTLREAVQTRDVIGQAKGILMERFLIDADAAFALLQRTSQETNTRVHDLAARLASTGKLPDS
jgi:AmiR/NasT family two-component response regulator